VREVTVNGVTAWLVDHPADWAEPPVLRLSVPVAIERGLTGRESRRTEGATLRAEHEWQATMTAAQAQSLLSGLQRYFGAPVIAPIWPLAICVEEQGTVPIVGGLLVAWRNEGAEWEVGAGIGDPAQWDWIAPAIWGVFLRTPEASAITPELFRASFSVTEDGPAEYALVPPAETFGPGPALPDGSTPPVFPWQVNWTGGARAGTAEIEVERRDMGPGRETAPAIYPQEAERPPEGTVTLGDQDEIARFLRWWLDQGGNSGGHWAPALIAPTRLAADATAGNQTLLVRSGANLAPELGLVLQMSYCGPEMVRIASVTGDTVTLAAGLVNDWEEDETIVMPLILARHARGTAELSFRAPAIAEARLAWREVAAEDVLTGDEVRGSTIGRLPERAWLYTIETERGGVVTTDRFTSYEADLLVSGELFDSRPCDHTEIRHTIRLDRDEITLTLRWWDSCPLAAFLPGRLDTAVRLVIEACQPANGQGQNPRQVFGGQITGVEFDGPFLQASAAGASSLFDRLVPALLFETTCNWDVYGRGCGLDRDLWTFTATVASASGAQITIQNISAPGATPPGFGFADWFALGIVARADRQSASFVSRSTALSGGLISLELDRPLSPQVTLGDTILIAPGCDGRSATCRAWNATTNPEGKFDNFLRFGGFPEIPATNPIVQPIGTPTGGGKK